MMVREARQRSRFPILRNVKNLTPGNRPEVGHTQFIFMTNSSALSKTIAGVRIATSIFFLLFGEYKVAGAGFAHGGFQNYLHDYIASSAVGFYRPFLSGVIQPHAVFFGYMVGVIELYIGISLLLGFWVRP